MSVGCIPAETEEQPQLDYTLYDSISGKPNNGTTPNSSLPGAQQTVFRQYWAEASQAFFSSCALMIDEPAAFRCFAQSGEPIVSQIRRLIVLICGKKSHNFPMYWQDVFNSTLVGRLVSLEGVSFTGIVYWGPHRDSTEPEVMSGYHWKMIKMPETIHSFQQHKMREELTTVDFEPDDERSRVSHWTYQRSDPRESTAVLPTTSFHTKGLAISSRIDALEGLR